MTAATPGQAAYEAWHAKLAEHHPVIRELREPKPWNLLSADVHAEWEAAAQASHAAIAAQQPHAADGLRDRLEALLESWSSPAPGEQAGACTAALRHALEDHLPPAASRGREGRLTAALARLAADGQWLTCTDDGRLDIRDELLARSAYARNALAGNVPAEPQPGIPLRSDAETCAMLRADLADAEAERDQLREQLAAVRSVCEGASVGQLANTPRGRLAKAVLSQMGAPS